MKQVILLNVVNVNVCASRIPPRPYEAWRFGGLDSSRSGRARRSREDKISFCYSMILFDVF